MIRNGTFDFSSLAISISICSHTKNNGGDTGWIALSEATEIVPRDVALIASSLNKGDLKIVPSKDQYGIPTWYIIQLMDVVTKLNKVLVKRRRENYLAMKGATSSLTYSIETMGCQMNIADSERMEGQLRDLGYEKVTDSSSAALVILNTCSIRDHAEQKVYSYIGPHALRKRQGEDVSIVVAGCVAQQEAEKLAKRFPEVIINQFIYLFICLWIFIYPHILYRKNICFSL